MAARPRIEGVIKVVYTWRTPNQVNAVNIFHVGTIGRQPVTLNDFDIIKATMSSQISGNFLAYYDQIPSGDYSKISVVLSDLGAQALQAEVLLTGTGAGGQPALPPQCSIVLSWFANSVTWRGGRFRTYIPGVPSTALVSPDSAALTTSFRNGTVGLAGNMMNSISGAGTSVIYNLGGVSYFSGATGGGPSPPRANALWFPFNNVTVHGRLDSQRKRSGKESSYT